MKSFQLLVLIVILGFKSYSQSHDKLQDAIGENTFKQMMMDPGIYENEDVLNLVKKIGKNLESYVEENSYEFKYYLLDTDVPNAFATGGGYVFVTRGLLAIIDTEDELAGILAHEFNHVFHKHITKKVYRSVPPMILKVPGSIVGLVFPKIVKNIINAPFDLTFRTANAAFDRHQEEQADKSGMELILKSKYNPYGLISALSKLEIYVENLTGHKEKFNLLTDHPITSKRLEYLRALIPDRGIDDHDQTELHSELKDLLVGNNPKHGVLVDKNEFLHPKYEFKFNLPENWLVENSINSLNAMDSTQQSGLVLGFETETQNLDSALELFMRAKYSKEEPIKLDKKTIGDYSSRQIIIEGENKHQGSKMIITWIKIDSINMLKILAFANSSKDLQIIKKSLASFKEMTVEDRQKINYYVLAIDIGRNEAFREFLERKNLYDKQKFLCALNSVKLSQSVIGKTLKYLEERNYYE